MIENLLEQILPIIIHILEACGVLIITFGAGSAFYHYFRMHVLHLDANYPVKHQFANSMAMGLEFKLAAEIIKTALVETIDELIILGAIFLLRVAMTFIIEYEVRTDDKQNQNQQKNQKQSKDSSKS